jgi:hypothetical protein
MRTCEDGCNGCDDCTDYTPPTPMRESVADAMLIVESYGPWGADLNDAHRRQIVLADEVRRLASQLAHWKSFAVHAEGERAAWKKTATELDAELGKLRLDRGLVERGADMLTAYAELIRRDGASHVEEHHYLPEVEHTATELRARFVFGA